jgi:hypothetical protein
MTEPLTSAIVPVMSGFAAGAVVVEAVGDVVAFGAAVTAFVAATLRYRAVLRRERDEQIGRATAVGFFVGLLLTAALIAIDVVA